MRKILIFLILTFNSLFIFGQQRDSTFNKQIPQHYFSIYPLNYLVQQAGITYEYKPGRCGYAITPGFIYPVNVGSGTRGSLTRFFIAGPSSYGAYENYLGFFIAPQINYYLSKNKINKNGNLHYLSFKIMYKHLKLDTTGIDCWDDGSSDDYAIFRKQIDRCNILGAFILFGKKHYYKHLFNDMYFGLGLLDVRHKLIVAGEYSGYEIAYTSNPASNINPPKKEVFNQIIPTITFGINFGLKY